MLNKGGLDRCKKFKQIYGSDGKTLVTPELRSIP